MKVDFLEIIQLTVVIQLLIFSISLFLKKNRKLSNVLLGVHLTSQALGVFGSVANRNIYLVENYTHLMLSGYPFVFLWGPTFYFYVRAFAFPDFRLKWHHALHLLPSAIIFIYLVFSFYFYDAETKRTIVNSLFIARNNFPIYYFNMFQILVYCLLSLGVLKKYSQRLKDNFSSVAKINLSWLRYIIIFFISAFIATNILTIITFQFESQGYTLFFINFMIYFIFFNTIFFKGWNQQEIFTTYEIEEKVKYKSSNLTNEEAEKWIEKINNYIQINKPFLNPGLTINQLAEDLDISPRILSQILNEYFNQNFYDYISKLRIEEAKKILCEPGNKKTVLEIIYDTGYNSKSAFSLAFKKYTGLTPTEFRKRNEKKEEDLVK